MCWTSGQVSDWLISWWSWCNQTSEVAPAVRLGIHWETIILRQGDRAGETWVVQFQLVDRFWFSDAGRYRSALCHRCGFVKPEPYNLLVQRSNDLTFQRPNEGRFAPMSRPPYRPLRIVLSVFSALPAVRGHFIIFSTNPLLIPMFFR